MELRKSNKWKAGTLVAMHPSKRRNGMHAGAIAAVIGGYDISEGFLKVYVNGNILKIHPTQIGHIIK